MMVPRVEATGGTSAINGQVVWRGGMTVNMAECIANGIKGGK